MVDSGAQIWVICAPPVWSTGLNLSMVRLRWLWPNCRDGSVGEQDTLAEQVGFRPPVHLSLDHFDAVDVAFDGAGAVGRGELGDGGPVLAESFGEAAQLADRAGLGLGSPASRRSPRWSQSISAKSRTRSRVAVSTKPGGCIPAARSTAAADQVLHRGVLPARRHAWLIWPLLPTDAETLREVFCRPAGSGAG
jgi:hypothetical protein